MGPHEPTTRTHLDAYTSHGEKSPSAGAIDPP